MAPHNIWVEKVIEFLQKCTSVAANLDVLNS
jgi:hypothetical protein